VDKLCLFKNKPEIFNCQFKIEGTDASDAVIRLCLEFGDNNNVFFCGELKDDGNCEIPIPALKHISKNKGKLTIEAIVDSAYFKVYEAEVELKNSVEVKLERVESTIQPETKKQPKVKLEQIEKTNGENPYIQKSYQPKVMKSFDDFVKKMDSAAKVDVP